MSLVAATIWLAERVRIPEHLLIRFIHRLLRNRVKREWKRHLEKHGLGVMQMVSEFTRIEPGLLAVYPGRSGTGPWDDVARLILGSGEYLGCGFWNEGAATLEDAVAAMFSLLAKRSALQDAQRVLTIGDPFGAFARWVLKTYPECSVDVLIQDAQEQSWVEESLHTKVKKPGFFQYSLDCQRQQRYDRIFYLFGIERQQNIERTLEMLQRLLTDEGKLLASYFCHRKHLYQLCGGGADWLAKYFLPKGIMPCEDLLLHFQKHLGFERQWRVNGRHYQRTLQCLLGTLRAERGRVAELCGEISPRQSGALWYSRLDLFLTVARECFGYRNGEEWYLVHMLMGQLPKVGVNAAR